MLRRTLRISDFVLRKFKTLSVKPCINREDNSKRSQFSYTFIVVEITMKFLAFVNPPYIYQDLLVQNSWIN